jgi:hypothetical protein
LTERSSLPVANILPSDEKTIDRTGLVWPFTTTS